MVAVNDDESVLLLARCLYWVMPVVLLLWAVAAVRRLRTAGAAVASSPRRHAAGFVTALLVTIAVLWVSPPQMRMQFDETSLCGTAQNMHLHRTAMMGVAAVPAGGDGLELTDWNLDKRPPLFSFLVSLVHDVTGYRVANAFAVNALLLLLLFLMLAVAARNRAGPLAAVAAPLLVAGVPIVLVAATSAGFELLATALLVAVVLAALDYLAEPAPVRFQWLLANGRVFAQVRYESIFVFALVLGLVWLRSRRVRPGRFGIALMAAAPVLLLPIALLLWHARDPGFYLESGGRDLVSLANVAANIGPFLAAFFAPGLGHALPGALAIASVLVYAFWLARRRGTFRDLVVLAPVTAVTAIVWLWFYGNVEEPTALRLYLPVCVLAALGPLLLPAMFPSRALGLAVVVVAAAFAIPRAVDLHSGKIMPQHRTARLLDHIDRTLANVPHAVERTVWVTTVSQYLIIHGRAAIPPRAFAAREAQIRDADVFVLATPLDPILSGWFGDPEEVLAAHAADELGRAEDPDSDAVIVVYRLRR